MDILKNVYIQDGVKAIIYLLPLIYLIFKRKTLKIKYFWLFFFGFLLLFLGHFLDLLDEFEVLKMVFIIGGCSPLQDFFEDVIGFSLGFLLLTLALYKEFSKSKN